MKAFSSSSMVTATMANTCAVLLKLLKACHRHLLQRKGENFDSKRCARSWSRREGRRQGGGGVSFAGHTIDGLGWQGKRAKWSPEWAEMAGSKLSI